MLFSCKNDPISVGRGVKLIYYMQELFVRGDVRHRFAIMGKTDIASGVDYTVQGHAPQLEQVHFLPIRSRYGVLRIWQADKGNPLVPPVLQKDLL
jgi:hypothetical protein